MALLFDVLFDDFVGDVAATHAEVAARPQMASPELLSQMWKLVQHLVRRLAFQHLDEPADGHLRWHRDEQMHMIFRDVPFHNRYFQVTADFAQQLSESQSDFATHHGLAVLCDPDEVQMDTKDRMRAVAVICHAGEFSTPLKTAKAFA